VLAVVERFGRFGTNSANPYKIRFAMG